MKNINAELTKQWVTIKEAASFLGVSQDTLRRWERKGSLIPRRTVGGHRRYSKKQLERILKQPMTTLPSIPPSNDKTDIHKTSIYIQEQSKPSDINISTKMVLNDNFKVKLISFIRTNAITIGISFIVLGLLIASFLLLSLTTSKESEFLSPLPSYKLIQTP